MDERFFEEYTQFLLSAIPSAHTASGGREVKCRCFYCPDSKVLSHSHFYISIPSTKEEPSKYYCQKCGECGIVTHNTLLDWGIWSDDIALKLINHNKHIKISANNNKLTIYRLANDIISDNNVSQYKLAYINDRLGTNYTYEDLKNLKIVLNLGDIIKRNGISRLTRDVNIVDQLDKNFIGFISIDNAFLNMRRLCDEGLVYKSIDKRYINYNIFGKMDTSQRFYTIPTKVDITKGPVNIHIAEGPFDILSIYENVRHREPGVYTSIGGANYLGVILYMIEVIKLPWVEVHIYPDNDSVGSNSKMKYVHRVLQGLNIPMYIHRNTYPNEKDFGVRSEHIREQITDMQEIV